MHAGVNKPCYRLRCQYVCRTNPVSVNWRIVQAFAARCKLGSRQRIHPDNVDAALSRGPREQSPGLIITIRTAAPRPLGRSTTYCIWVGINDENDVRWGGGTATSCGKINDKQEIAGRDCFAQPFRHRHWGRYSIYVNVRKMNKYAQIELGQSVAALFWPKKW
jgi:hypothetical protein